MNRIHLVLVLSVVSLSLAACGGAAPPAEHGGMGMNHAGGGHDCMGEHHEGGMACEHPGANGQCECDHEGGEHAEATGPLVPPGEAHVGDSTSCPVSGEHFVVTDQSPHAEYEGHTYYFCCPGCIERFNASPAQYAHPAAAAAPQS